MKIMPTYEAIEHDDDSLN